MSPPSFLPITDRLAALLCNRDTRVQEARNRLSSAGPAPARGSKWSISTTDVRNRPSSRSGSPVRALTRPGAPRGMAVTSTNDRVGIDSRQPVECGTGARGARMAVEPSWYPRLIHVYPTLGLAAASYGRELSAQGVAVRAGAGAVLFEPVDFSTRFPFLLEGVARVLKVGASSRDTLLYRIRAGEHCLLSSAGLLARWRFGARVVAETDVEAIVIPGPLFRALVRDSREFAHSVHVAIARHLEIVMDLVEQATYFRLDQRVASMLLARGSPVAASHQELADDLGASRENVSRILAGFRNHGWVALGRRRIEIFDPSALESLLDREA